MVLSEMGTNQVEAMTATANSLWSLTTLGLRDLTHDSGRRLLWMPGHEIGWSDPASGIRCFDGEEIVATINMSVDPSRAQAAFVWLMTGEWSA
jgi:hypothetical protein